MDTNDIRSAKINGLRKMADWLEANSDIPIPRALGGCVFLDMSEARDIRKTAHGWTKSTTEDYFQYTLRFAPDNPEFNGTNYIVYVQKSEQTCRRVQVGTKHVEAIEAHDVPVYEWQCEPVKNDEAD